MIRSKYLLEPASPGAILRDEARRGTAVGLEAERYTLNGQMVPDSIAISLVCGWLGNNRSGGFIFDGFPRSLIQAQGLEEILREQGGELDAVFFLDVPEEELCKRITHRVICESCGKTFRAGLHVRSVSDSCPMCGGSLGKRQDDNIDALNRRMLEYRTKTEPLVGYYREKGLLSEIDGSQTPDSVFCRISAVLEDFVCR